MSRDTSFDNYTYTLLTAFVNVLRPLDGLGQVGGTGAVYPRLGLPMPQEPFPAVYCYLGGVKPDYTFSAADRLDSVTVVLRVLGGPVTPMYKVNPEDAVNKLVTAIINELDYRPYLQDPSNNNAPLRYIAPRSKVMVSQVGRIQGFAYSDQGAFVGVELTCTVDLLFHMPRLS